MASSKLRNDKLIPALNSLSVCDNKVNYNDLTALLKPVEVIRFSDLYSEMFLHPVVLKTLKASAREIIHKEKTIRVRMSDIVAAYRNVDNGEPEYKKVEIFNQEDLDVLIEGKWGLYKKHGSGYELVFDSSEVEHIYISDSKREAWGQCLVAAAVSEVGNEVHWNSALNRTSIKDYVSDGSISKSDYPEDAVVARVLNDDFQISNEEFITRYIGLLAEPTLSKISDAVSEHRWAIFTVVWNINSIELHRLGDSRAYMWVREQLDRQAQKELEE